MSVTYADFGTRQRGLAPLLPTRPPELGDNVVKFQPPCPTWCTRDEPHTRHMAAAGAIGARTEGRMDLITVLVRQDHGGDTLVDLRALAPEGKIGALLNADALDEVIEALLAARRIARPISSRSLPSAGGGRASTPLESA